MQEAEMIREVVSQLPMNLDFTTDWLESTMTDFAGNNEKGIGYIQIIWTGVSANPDANIRVEVTNDLQYTSVTANHLVTSSDNSTNALMIAVYPGFRFIRFIYTANTVSSGRLSININYE